MSDCDSVLSLLCIVSWFESLCSLKSVWGTTGAFEDLLVPSKIGTHCNYHSECYVCNHVLEFSVVGLQSSEDRLAMRWCQLGVL